RTAAPCPAAPAPRAAPPTRKTRPCPGAKSIAPAARDDCTTGPPAEFPSPAGPREPGLSLLVLQWRRQRGDSDAAGLFCHKPGPNLRASGDCRRRDRFATALTRRAAKYFPRRAARRPAAFVGRSDLQRRLRPACRIDAF